MELRCPSCGIVHRTEDYPGAFEINCVCGYSILVPDEKAFSVPVDAPSSKVPTALEEEDNAISVKPEIVESEEASLMAPEGMTSPDQLPEGMAYDRFELASEDGSASGAFPAPPDEVAPASENFESPSEKASSQMTGQAIVDRTLAANLGQLLGPSYRLALQGLSREQKNILARRCQDLAKARPWIALELERRGFKFEEMPDQSSLEGVPEVLAVEIYLGCFEMGGSCSFEKLP